MQELGKACDAYLLASADGSEMLLDFARKTSERARQRVADTGVDRDTAYRDMAVDWLSDNRGKLERRDLKTVLIVCWWFTKLIESGIGLPAVVRDNMSSEDAQDFIKFLNEQTRRARDAKKNARHDKGGGSSS